MKQFIGGPSHGKTVSGDGERISIPYVRPGSNCFDRAMYELRADGSYWLIAIEFARSEVSINEPVEAVPPIGIPEFRPIEPPINVSVDEIFS